MSPWRESTGRGEVGITDEAERGKGLGGLVGNEAGLIDASEEDGVEPGIRKRQNSRSTNNT